MADKRLHLLFLILMGCQPSQINLPEREPISESVPLASAFDAVTSARIGGRIHFVRPGNAPPHWVFNIPEIPPVRRPIDNVKYEEIPNPNRPEYSDNGLAGAVVLLRGIDPARSRPWHHGPVDIEITDCGIFVHQDGQTGRVGFVRRSDTVIFRNASSKVQGIRGRGAEFFSHIITASQVRRRFEQPGRVEISSASGQYWASADLFVSDTPYMTRTGPNGNYEFDGVPPGDYEFSVYLPNWNVDFREIDPETSLVVRQKYASPFEYSEKIHLKAGESIRIDRTLNAPQPGLNP